MKPLVWTLSVVVAVLGALTSACVVQASSVYFVSPGGSDDSPGSWSAPLLTIGAATGRATAGDLVVATAGVYREAVVLTRSGTQAAPIVIRGLPGAILSSPDPSASLSAFEVACGVAFVTIEGFELTGGFDETVFVRANAHDIQLSGLHVHHNHTGIWIGGATDVTVRDSQLDHNYRTGVRVFAGAHHVRIVDTRSEANDDGSGCDGDSDGFNADPTTSDVWFERATAVGNSEDGFDLQGPNMVLLQVVAQDNGCSGVKLAGGGYLENALVERSRIGLNVNAPAGSATVLENGTLSQNDIGMRAIGAGHAVVVRNTIVSGPGKAIVFPSGVDLREDHNLLYRPLPTDRLIVRTDAGGETMYSGNELNDGRWRRDSGQGQGTAYGNPGMDPGTCRLLADSSAIDSGGSPAIVPVDLAGTQRPEGNGIDRGAFEWVAATPTLRVMRGMLHMNATGSGSVHLRAEMDTPAGWSFDPQLDTVALTVRGARGAILTVSPDKWRSSSAADGTLLRARWADASGCSAHAVLHLRGGLATLRVSARAADVWVADRDGVDLTIDLGRIHANAHEPARRVGQTLHLLPGGGGG